MKKETVTMFFDFHIFSPVVFQSGLCHHIADISMCFQQINLKSFSLKIPIIFIHILVSAQHTVSK